jgi:hypothetical protein
LVVQHARAPQMLVVHRRARNAEGQHLGFVRLGVAWRLVPEGKCPLLA